jgi:site-specific DNA recombinase
MQDTPGASVHAAIYARVSTEDQGKGYSIETQIAGCQRYAAQHGMAVWQSHVFVDRGISGATLDRPGLDAMRKLIRSRAIQAVIVYDVDRLSRNLGHQCLLVEEQRQAGVNFHPALHPVDATPEGQLLLQMLGAFAELERAKIRERSMRGTQKRFDEGLPHGHVAPYGYRWVGTKHTATLEIDPDAAEVVRRVFQWCLEGRSVRSITKQLTQEHIPTSRATCPRMGTQKTPSWYWNTSSVHRMLRQTAYVGRLYEGKVRISGKLRVKQPREHWKALTIEPIIDQDTFDAVAVALVRHQQGARRNRKYDYLFSGQTLRCGRCGNGLYASTTAWYYGGRRHTATYYQCNTKVNRPSGPYCRGTLSGRRVEPLVWRFVEQLLDHPKLILEAIALAHEGGAEQRLEAQRRLDSLDRQLDGLTQADIRLIEAYTGGAMSVDELKAHRERLSQQKQRVVEEHWEAQEALAQCGASPPEPYALDEHIASVRQHLTTGSLAERRTVMDLLALVVTWIPDAPLRIEGTVPSLTPGVLCTWQTHLSDDLNLTLDF